MNIKEKIQARLAMLCENVTSDELLEYSIKISTQQAADYCNLNSAEYFPIDAEIYLIEYGAACYLLENSAFLPRWEKMKKDAEISLLRFRRVRW